MKRHPNLIAISSLLAAALLLGACGASATLGGRPDSDLSFESPVEEEMMEAAVGAPSIMADSIASDEAFARDQELAVASQERLVIKNADMRIVVQDPANAQGEIAALAEGMGGFVVSSNIYQTQTATGLEVPTGSITVRVPAERLQEALDTIEGLAVRVESKNESGQDVTAQYTDLQSRLRNLEDAEELLRQIMEEARDTEDVLTAFNQLNNITEQIEVLKGQIQYYEEAAAMSAISVSLIPSAADQPITIGGWEPVGVAKDAIQALVDALQGLVNALIWFALYLLPILLIIGIPVWLIVRALRKRRSQADS